MPRKPNPSNVQSSKKMNFIKASGKVMLNHQRYTERAWKAKFGCSVFIVTLLWGFIGRSEYSSLFPSPLPLLWTLFWLKNYPTWDEFSNILDCDVKTGRQKVYLTLSVLYKVFKQSSIVCSILI